MLIAMVAMVASAETYSYFLTSSLFSAIK